MTRANVLLAAATVVFGSGCLILFRDLGVERSRVQTLEEQLVQAQHELQASERRSSENALAPASTPAARPATPETSSRPANAAVANKPAAAEQRDEMNEWRRRMADPAYRTAMVADHRRRLEPGYADLAAELKLEADETDRFLDLLAEQSLRQNELIERDAQNDERSPEERRRRHKEHHERAAAEQKALLGEQRFRAWTDYVNSAGARAQISELRMQLATSSSPLRKDQIKPLVEALTTEHQRHAAERRQHHGTGAQWTEETSAAEQMAYMKRRAELIEESLARSSEAAAMYLDSEQQTRFDGILERYRKRARADVELWRVSLETEAKREQRAGIGQL